MGEKRDVYRVLVGTTDGNRPLERPRQTWEDIKKDVQEVRCECMDWIDVAWDRNGWQALLNTVMNLQVPYSAGNYLTS